MKIIDLAQGSDEWFNFRSTKVTATDVAAICGVSEYSTARQKWMEKLGLLEKEENAFMTRGKKLEPVARDYFNQKHNCNFQPCVGVSEEYPWLMASFDGIENSNVLEIKCTSLKKIDQATHGVISLDYILQLYTQMIVSNAKMGCLFFFHEDLCHEVWTHSNAEDFLDWKETILIKGKKFYDINLIDLREPNLQEKDEVEREDEEWQRRLNRYLNAKKSRELAEEIEDMEKSRLCELANPECATKGFGYSVKKTIRKGKVNYLKIPELEGVNLDPYRKESTIFWNVRECS